MDAPLDLPGEFASPLLTDGYIDKWLQRRICARCYGELTKVPVVGGWKARCLRCNGEWGGTTISRRWAEKMGQQAIADWWEVRANLPDLYPPIYHDLSPASREAKIMADLGY